MKVKKTLTFENTLYHIIDNGDIGNGWKYVEVINKKMDFALPKCLYYKGKQMKNLLCYSDYVNHLDTGKEFINDFIKDIFRECYPGSKNPICKVKENLMIGGAGRAVFDYSDEVIEDELKNEGTIDELLKIVNEQTDEQTNKFNELVNNVQNKYGKDTPPSKDIIKVALHMVLIHKSDKDNQDDIDKVIKYNMSGSENKSTRNKLRKSFNSYKDEGLKVDGIDINIKEKEEVGKEEAAAATKIQAVFRGTQGRKKAEEERKKAEEKAAEEEAGAGSADEVEEAGAEEKAAEAEEAGAVEEAEVEVTPFEDKDKAKEGIQNYMNDTNYKVGESSDESESSVKIILSKEGENTLELKLQGKSTQGTIQDLLESNDAFIYIKIGEGKGEGEGEGKNLHKLTYNEDVISTKNIFEEGKDKFNKMGKLFVRDIIRTRSKLKDLNNDVKEFVKRVENENYTLFRPDEEKVEAEKAAEAAGEKAAEAVDGGEEKVEEVEEVEVEE